MADPLSTEELHERVERRQLGPEGQGHRAFVFKEVCIENRRADAISVGLWQSRGFKVEGFELKTNRKDWLREYEDHQKAEPAMAICDHFWLVVNRGVVEEHELPEKWGLLEAPGRKRNLVVVKPAPALREGEQPVSRSLLASFIRGAYDLKWARENEIREEERDRFRDLADLDFESLQRRLKTAEEANESMQEAFEAFRRESGFQFMGWRPQPADFKILGQVAKAMKEGPQMMENLLHGIKHDEDRALAVRKHLKEARQAIEEETS